MRHRYMSSVAASAIISATREYATMMAVVTKYASGYPGGPDPTVQPQDLDPIEEFRGHMRELVSTVEIANGDSATSTLYFGKVPTSARLSVKSRLDHDAITGVNSFSLGGQVVGQAAAPNALMNAVDITAAGNKPALSAVNIDSLHKALWQLLGYASDPGGEASIYGTLNAAATAAGTVTLSLEFKVPM